MQCLELCTQFHYTLELGLIPAAYSDIRRAHLLARAVCTIPVYVVKFNEIWFCHFVLYGIVSYDTSSMYCILLRIV